MVVGGGHNGLVAAALLARAGKSVLLLERRETLGGAAISTAPFPEFPGARLSRYAYLVSLFPAALLRMLDLPIELRSRRIGAYTPQDSSGLLLEDDPVWPSFQTMLARVAERLFPTLIEPLRPREQLRRRLEDDEAWEALFETPLSDLLERTFASDLTRGTVLTDGLIGTFAPADDPLLRQNRCFLYHTIGGPWRVPVGGMGALTDALAGAARKAGAHIAADAEVVSIATDDRNAEVTCADGRRYCAHHVLAALAPRTLRQLLGRPVAGDAPEGSQLKVNMLLGRLPRLRDRATSAEDAFTGTFHVNEGYEQLHIAYEQASQGQIPALPPCEMYCHSLTDPTILSRDLGARGVHALTLFGLHMPNRLFTDAKAKDRAVAATLRSLNEVLAEPIEDCLLCLEALTPPELEAELAMPGGHIFHQDLSWPFAESDEEVGRWGVETEHANVWLCGAGARRGGGVSGIPGHNAARAVLETL